MQQPQKIKFIHIYREDNHTTDYLASIKY
ncbi:hypothetical protein LINGRAHAP2_LOCUS61 [Linum grandiflorum]